MTEIVIRRAEEVDLPQIVAMLADYPPGASSEYNEQPLQPGYIAAFIIIDTNAAQMLVVAEADGCAVATLQMNFVVGLAREGMRRAFIENVRVATEWRGHGLGGRMVEWAIEEARRRRCGIVQLMSDAPHEDEQRFYERLGFKWAPGGSMKLEL